MSLTIRWADVSGLKRMENALAKLDGPQKALVLQRAVNHTGDKARTQVVRTLAKQTGLNYGVIKKAIKRNGVTNAFIGGDGAINIRQGGHLTYQLTATGGDISLKFFKARETRDGVTASPLGKRQLFAGTFIKGGRFPNRVAAKGLNGHVYKRTGKDRGPLELQNSGVIIPQEMISGATASVFTKVVESDLPGRVAHEIGRLIPGFFD